MSRLVPSYDGTEGEANVLTMAEVGPVASRYREDRSFIASIMGPYGSAKTTTTFQKILNSALWQTPDKHGVRKVRWCVIRDTYDQLRTNVMEDWFAWFPKTDKNWNGETNTHTVTLSLDPESQRPDIAIQMLFRGLGDRKAEQVFKGMQLTGLWLNEADTLSMQVLKYGLPRVGRFPQAKDGGCAWSGIVADFNAPDIDNWIYDLLVNKEIDVPEEVLLALRETYGPLYGINFHRQPGGNTPEAENLHNLPDGYYDRLRIGLSENEQRRFIGNEFGAVNNGQPVFPEYNDDFHCSKDEIKPLPGVPIVVAIDGGSTPAAVFLQEDPDTGQVRALAEFVVFNTDDKKILAKLGATAFGRECREFADRLFPHNKIGDARLMGKMPGTGGVWGDPAGFMGGHEEDLAWMETFGKAFGVKVKPSPVKGNRLEPRLDAVRSCLTKNVGSRPGIIIDGTRCKHLRRGFNNGYVIGRVRYSDGSGRWKDEPNKNDFSHVHDALQYGVVALKRRGRLDDDLDARAARLKQSARVKRGGSYFSGRM